MEKAAPYLDLVVFEFIEKDNEKFNYKSVTYFNQT